MTRPRPDAAFEWVETAGGPALVCQPLAIVARHLYTVRSWRLGAGAGNRDPAAWADVAHAMDVEPNDLRRVHQVHGADVIVSRADQPPPTGAKADIILSKDPTTALSIQTADCVPLLIGDR